ncbi:hypothetical protein [Rhizobium sp. NFR07]|nr:hypothetical protein [Rhizobium sp. NFR07]
MKEELIPVASPGFIEKHRIDPVAIRPDEIARLDLIDYERYGVRPAGNCA